MDQKEFTEAIKDGTAEGQKKRAEEAEKRKRQADEVRKALEHDGWTTGGIYSGI